MAECTEWLMAPQACVGCPAPPDLCGRRKDQLAWDRLRGGGDGGWGQMQRTGPGPGASSPLPAPPCPAGCLARIRWPGVLPAVPGGGRARAAGWLAAPPGWQARGGSAKANGGLRSHGGGPFSTRLAFPLLAGSRAQAWRSPSRASRLCCQGSVWFGAASSLGLRLRGSQGSPLPVSCPLEPGPSGCGVWSRKPFVDCRLAFRCDP